jgi:hypothetical protein
MINDKQPGKRVLATGNERGRFPARLFVERSDP